MLIVLNGPPKAGKTTVAGIIDELHEDVFRLDLTYPFTSFIANCFGISMEELKRLKDEKNLFNNPQITFRDLQIEVANVLEKADPAIWIKRALFRQYSPDKLFILDSIGKQSQWDWLVNESDVSEIVLVYVLPEEWIKSNRIEMKFRDGRDFVFSTDRIGKRNKIKKVLQLPNSYPSQGDATSMMVLRNSVRDLWQNIMGLS